MILELFFCFFQITKAININKIIIGEWQVYDKANTTSLYTIEFHKNLIKTNSTSNTSSTIAASAWSNKIDDSNRDELDNFDPANCIISTFELVFTSQNEGEIKNSNTDGKYDNQFLHNSHFSINEIENKNIKITFNSKSLKLTCILTNPTNGIIKYQLLNVNDAESTLYIMKSPKLSFFQWAKFFAYAFYAVFIIILCRAIFVTRSFLIQRARENEEMTYKQKEKRKRDSQNINKSDNSTNDIKDHHQKKE